MVRYGCSYFPRFIARFNGVVLSMAGDVVPIDNVVTSSIYLEIYQLGLSVSVFIEVQCICLRCTMLCKKEKV